jgi:hypothetical protein
MNMRTLSIARSVAIIGGTAALIVGVTFASFQSNTASLTGTTFSVNEIQDVLRIYDFNPGGYVVSSDNPSSASGAINLNLTLNQESAKQRFYLQNTGASDLGITAMASGTPAGDLDPAKVMVKFYDDAATPALLGSATLADLQSASTPLNTLPVGAAGDSNNLGTGHAGNYQVSFTLTSSASGNDTLSGVNINFTGTPE